MCKYSYMDTPKTHFKNKTNLLKEKNPITDMGATEIAQSVQCFLHKRENQSSDPQHSHQKLEVAMCTCNPKAGEAKTGVSLGLVGQLIHLNW